MMQVEGKTNENINKEYESVGRSVGTFAQKSRVGRAGFAGSPCPRVGGSKVWVIHRPGGRFGTAKHKEENNAF